MLNTKAQIFRFANREHSVLMDFFVLLWFYANSPYTVMDDTDHMGILPYSAVKNVKDDGYCK